MDSFWKDAVKVTGSVGVVGFILWFFLKKLYSAEILSRFPNEDVFTLTVIITVFLLSALIIAILKHGKKGNDKDIENKNRVVKIDRSQVNGDIVLGDKNDHRKEK